VQRGPFFWPIMTSLRGADASVPRVPRYLAAHIHTYPNYLRYLKQQNIKCIKERAAEQLQKWPASYRPWIR
jgi:hypothetical protein